MHASAARVWALRAGPENLVVGLASYYEALALSAGAGNVNWTHVKVRAESAEVSLRSSHRIPQAARAALVQAEALRRMAESDTNPSSLLAEAVVRVATAIALLADAGSMSKELVGQGLKQLSQVIEVELADTY